MKLSLTGDKCVAEHTSPVELGNAAGSDGTDVWPQVSKGWPRADE